jgi:hypothetical protein
LITAPSHDKAPLLMTELPADRTVAVIELRNATPTFDAQSRPRQISQVAFELASEEKNRLILSLFQPEAVVARLDYQIVQH